MAQLGKIERINDLRTIWPHEANDFSKWLAQDENLALLSDTVGIDKVSTLYISQVKRKLGLEVSINYNQAKLEKSKTPQCPKDKENGIVDALKYYKMI